jgi:hypothetical protein
MGHIKPNSMLTFCKNIMLYRDVLKLENKSNIKPNIPNVMTQTFLKGKNDNISTDVDALSDFIGSFPNLLGT